MCVWITDSSKALAIVLSPAYTQTHTHITREQEAVCWLPVKRAGHVDWHWVRWVKNLLCVYLTNGTRKANVMYPAAGNALCFTHTHTRPYTENRRIIEACFFYNQSVVKRTNSHTFEQRWDVRCVYATLATHLAPASHLRHNGNTTAPL